MVANLIKNGFGGEIYPINPQAKEILDLPCSPSLAEVRKPIDLCVIAVPPPSVKAAVEEALAAHVRAVAVLTAGFKEIGEEGAALEAEEPLLPPARVTAVADPAEDLEKLATEVARLIVTEYPVTEVTVTVEKPGALRFARSVGVTVTRGCEDFQS